MEHYDLRSCFLPNLYGLQLRMYQFTQLLGMHLPELSAHLNNLGIQPTYASQWFLSFFAISCPLPMLFRVYDVIFAEGAPETIMRVALSLMRRNEKRLLATSEFEDVLQMLLARGLWDTYNFNANDLVQDFVGLTGVVTSQGLADLEKRFKEEHPDDNCIRITPTKSSSGSDLQAAASRFLGRMWGGGTSPGPVSLSPASGQSRPTSSILMRRTPSKQSLSTVSSFDTSDTGSGSTDCSSVDDRRVSTRSISSTRRQNKDGELHGQIEDLLMALSALQREHAAKVDELQTVKAEREEERVLAKRLVELLANGSQDGDGGDGGDGGDSITEISDLCDQITENLARAESETVITPKPSTAQLEEELQRAREQIHRETVKSRDLANKLAEQDADVVRLKSQLLDARSKWQESQKEKQQLQKTINELKHPLGSPELRDREGGETQKGGLRELRLGRSNSTRSQQTPTFNKRSSSLGMQAILTQDNNSPAATEALLLELVASKTAEAVAKQEAEEAKAKLESLRRVLGGGGTNSSSSSVRDPPLSPGLDRTGSGSSFSSFLSVAPPNPSPPAPSTASTGFWSGWGKKSTAVDSR